MTNKKTAFVCFLTLSAFILFGTSVAWAALSGPVWPAPGGTSYIPSGNEGSTGGKTFSYSGFDSTKYDKLYWGPSEGATIGASLNGSGISGSEIMNFSSFSGNKAYWTGSSTWTWIDGGGTQHINEAINTRMTLTLTGASFQDASALGKSSVGVLAQVNNDYAANILFEAQFGSTWMPVRDGYNLFETDPAIPTGTTFNGGFYYTPVPVPAAVWLFGSGLVGLIGLRRKFGK